MRQAILVALMLAATAPAALAQPYPSKPIRFILNGAPGAFSDVTLRVAAQELAKQTGQPWVVENRPGGDFVIAAVACKAAAPDGYTVCVVNEQSMSLNPHVISKLPYDPDADFKPVTNLFIQVSGLIASTSVGSIAELLRQAEAKPGSMNFATMGPSTTQDILRQWINNHWKAGFVDVPYKGMNAILNGIVSGEVNATQAALGSARPYLAGGKVKLLAVNSARRLPNLPDVPTYTEAGLGEFIDVQGRFWWGLVAPGGTPDAMVQRLNAAFAAVFAQPKFAELLETQYLQSAICTPEEFATFLKRDRARDAQVVKRFNVPRQ